VTDDAKRYLLPDELGGNAYGGRLDPADLDVSKGPWVVLETGAGMVLVRPSTVVEVPPEPTTNRAVVVLVDTTTVYQKLNNRWYSPGRAEPVDWDDVCRNGKPSVVTNG
jgi:hypothetical protein